MGHAGMWRGFMKNKRQKCRNFKILFSKKAQVALVERGVSGTE